jgi:hypothetical protein
VIWNGRVNPPVFDGAKSHDSRVFGHVPTALCFMIVSNLSSPVFSICCSCIVRYSWPNSEVFPIGITISVRHSESNNNQAIVFLLLSVQLLHRSSPIKWFYLCSYISALKYLPFPDRCRTFAGSEAISHFGCFRNSLGQRVASVRGEFWENMDRVGCTPRRGWRGPALPRSQMDTDCKVNCEWVWTLQNHPLSWI